MKRINVLLMVLVVAVLAASTFVNKMGGGDGASAGIYASWWFVLLMALVGLGAVAAIFREKMWRVPYRLLLYGSVVVILLGGGLTTWTGCHGSMTLQPGVPCDTFANNEDGKEWTLPFALTLDRFEVVSYPGSHTPMDFVSHITNGNEKAVISMNHIYRHDGYRFYQEDYDQDGNSTLSVAHDPLGIAVTYAGYLMLLAGLIAMFLSPKSHFRKLLKGVPLVLLLVACNTVSAKPMTLPRHTADQLGRVQVLYKGRVCPLQTLAKDFTTKLYGNATYQGLTPEQVLGGWMFYYSEWCDEPMIKIKGAGLRQQLGMESRYTSFNNLLAHEDLLDQHPSAKEFASATEKTSLVQMVTNSKLLKIYPLTDSSGTLGWYSQNDDLPIEVDNDVYIFVRKQLGYCQELVVRGDYATLDTVFAKTCQYQQKQAGEVLPSPARIKAERLYNALTTGRCGAGHFVVCSDGLDGGPRGGRLETLCHQLPNFLSLGGTADVLPAPDHRAAVGGRRSCAYGRRLRQHEPDFGHAGHCGALHGSPSSGGTFCSPAGDGLLPVGGDDERFQPTDYTPDACAQLALADLACDGNNDCLCALFLCDAQRHGSPLPA